MSFIHSFKRVLALGLLCSPFYIQAQDPTAVNITANAVPFLRISGDARASGMGDAALATTADAFSSLWNNSKIVFGKQKTALAVNYTPWLKDIADKMYLANISGYHQLTEQHAISFSMRYFKIGDVELTDYAGNKLQTVNPYEWSADLGYAFRLSDQFAVGLAFRYIQSKLGAGMNNDVQYKNGSALAGDLYFTYDGQDEDGEGFSAGLALSNLGTRLKYSDQLMGKEFLPANLGLGIGYTFLVDYDKQLLLTGDVNKRLVPEWKKGETPETYYDRTVMNSIGKSFEDQQLQASLGLEFRYQEWFALRAGYRIDDKQMGGFNHFSAGVGLRYEGAGIDFAYTVPSGSGNDRSPVSNTFRLGISWTK